MNCLVTRKVNGVEVTQFNPTPSMRLFALSALCDPLYIGKDPEVICPAIGLGKSSWKRFQEFNPYFEEWLEEMRLAIGGKNKRNLLEMVGIERALAGEFNFWKAMAIKHGTIAPDQLNVGAVIPSNLGAMKDLDDKQLGSLENSIMATLRSESVPGEIAMAEGPDGWQPEGHSGGAAEVPGSVVLADDLGDDRECALGQLERF
jgi:hypothetical protein